MFRVWEWKGQSCFYRQKCIIICIMLMLTLNRCLCCAVFGLGWVESTWNLGALLTAPQQSLFFLSFLGDHLPRTLSSTKRYSAFSFLLFLYRYFTEYLFFTSNIPLPLLPQYPFYPFNS